MRKVCMGSASGIGLGIFGGSVAFALYSFGVVMQKSSYRLFRVLFFGRLYLLVLLVLLVGAFR